MQTKVICMGPIKATVGRGSLRELTPHLFKTNIEIR
jgi:hypothetical protein